VRKCTGWRGFCLFVTLSRGRSRRLDAGPSARAPEPAQPLASEARPHGCRWIAVGEERAEVKPGVPNRVKKHGPERPISRIQAQKAIHADTPQLSGCARTRNANPSISKALLLREDSGFRRPRRTSAAAAFPRHVARAAKHGPISSRFERYGGWLATTRTNHRRSL